MTFVARFQICNSHTSFKIKISPIEKMFAISQFSKNGVENDNAKN